MAPTVMLPFNVAVVEVTDVAAEVVIDTAVSHDETLASVNEPPIEASSAASSFASCSLRSSMTSWGAWPAAISES
jgi:hypothetical protein